jgi:hypothetical protein
MGRETLVGFLAIPLCAVVLIGALAIARETSLFGPRHGFPIDWQNQPWRSFETVCMFITTVFMVLIGIKWLIGLLL